MRSSRSWWGNKVRQFRAHLGARVTDAEREELAAWVTPQQLRLFDAMAVADRRHGLDVVATLRAEAVVDRDLLMAGLLHDAGKGDVGVWPRVAYALGLKYGSWIWRAAAAIPRWRPQIERLRQHAATSAGLADAAGCSHRVVELIRNQDAPLDPEFGELLRLADEAN
jgi:hypothetical protein